MKGYNNFSPGPTQLYFTVEKHIQHALKEHVPSMSHRSEDFESLYYHTKSQLRALLNIPSSHHLLFTGSATEIWERTIQNLTKKTVMHFINGAFSKKFYDVSVALKRKATKIEVPHGEGFEEIIKTDAELIALTNNESSTGVMIPNAFIYALKEENPHAILVVDAVSSLPYSNFDYTKIDAVYFSVQKGFGLLPGLGVWIVNECCIDRATYLQKSGQSIGAHYALTSLIAYDKKNQTPHTPNILGIYLLGKVAEDMLKKGIDNIRKETDYKAAMLYEVLRKHPRLNAFVKKEKFKSSTLIVAETNDDSQSTIDLLATEGATVGTGYGSYKKKHIRCGNFPTHSKEQFEQLKGLLEEI